MKQNQGDVTTLVMRKRKKGSFKSLKNEKHKITYDICMPPWNIWHHGSSIFQGVQVKTLNIGPKRLS